MKITKIIAICAMLVCGAVAANAQPGFGGQQMNPEEMAKMRADRMKESLKLNNDQYTKIVELYKKESEEMMKMFQENQGGQPDFSAMQKRREAQDAELKKILTEDQYKQYTEQQQQMRGRMGQGGPRPGGPGQGGPRPR